MIKYSFVIPCYNGEKYIKKCLESIFRQKINNYEIIVTNDGSKDNSKEILESYVKSNNIKLINSVNKGLSNARNMAINRAKGQYIIFVDIDDYIKDDFLESIDREISDDLDLLKIGFTKVFTDKEEVADTCVFDTVNGKEAFLKLINSKTIFETAWSYVINRNFFLKNKFKFEVGKYHEDMGLIPYMITKSKKIKSISYNGYMYVQTQNSITRNTNYKKEYKKSLDIIYFFKKYCDMLDVNNETNKVLLSFLASACINRLNFLNGEYKRKYKEKLYELRISDYLIDDTITRKMKKILGHINIEWVVKKL